MDNKDIKKMLQYPEIEVIQEFLQEVISKTNLKENEYESIMMVDILGKTEKYASEKLRVSLRSIQNYRGRAYKKLNILLTYNDEYNQKAVDILKRLENF